MRNRRRIVLAAGAILGLAALITGSYIVLVVRSIDSRMQQLRAGRPSQFFGVFPPFQVGQIFLPGQLKLVLEDQGYVEKPAGSDLLSNEYSWGRAVGGKRSLFLARGETNHPGYVQDRLEARMDLEEVNKAWRIAALTENETDQVLQRVDGIPKKLGAFYAGRLRTQNPIALADMPVSIRYAVMAIEDSKFLEHSGVSLRSTIRALWRDVRAGRWVEGGSTITQQLMKNLFFSREKALKRKLKEALYAVITESRYSKEDILEAYLNEVYLGQWRTHEIHGVSEGALYYFNRDLSRISIAQSATLAAIIQAPNAHDPHRFSERLVKRRNLVLKRMWESEFILEEEYLDALKEPLAVVPSDRTLDDIDYFLDLLFQRLPGDLRQRLDSESLTIYTSLNPYLQTAAANALRKNLERIRESSPNVKKLEKKGIQVQSALVAIDLNSCNVVALQGGKSYRQTQFNRVLQGMRQPGSLFKPFVFLPALDPQQLNPPLTTLTEIDDAPFEWKYDGQSWSPRNYDNQFRGPVTAGRALQESLNVPTAKIAERVGVDAIVDTLKAAGIHSTLPAVPSVSLGSAEVTPIELAEAYSSLASLGHSCSATPYHRVFDSNGNLVMENNSLKSEVLSPQASFATVNILKGVFTKGTAKSAAYSGLNLSHFAGKTGTTNEYKDAWFVGFSANFLALVWVGYDEEAKIGLTGAAAALPLWLDFIKQAQPFLLDGDFVAPEGVAAYTIDTQTKRLATPRCPHTETEFLITGTEPDPCIQHQ